MAATTADAGGRMQACHLFRPAGKMATNEQRSLGLDIADFLLMEDTPQMILARMIQRNPALQTFIDTFGLELVDAEKRNEGESMDSSLSREMGL